MAEEKKAEKTVRVKFLKLWSSDRGVFYPSIDSQSGKPITPTIDNHGLADLPESIALSLAENKLGPISDPVVELV